MKICAAAQSKFNGDGNAKSIYTARRNVGPNRLIVRNNAIVHRRCAEQRHCPGTAIRFAV